ncbi:hypothetical protein [Saccharothrix sp. ST-888]|uniref:hypothetical protein n=1 Tax=Saccharothrix sp. ST-888 TaxID=1427391 RepID=UPI0005EC5A01|nr:hypothetical protein [Saccharothrix sp. ST-888]KJK56307.1 hypothetical protein UK12_23455 [Saccharothrix sp. ST-888]
MSLRLIHLIFTRLVSRYVLLSQSAASEDVEQHVLRRYAPGRAISFDADCRNGTARRRRPSPNVSPPKPASRTTTAATPGSRSPGFATYVDSDCLPWSDRLAPTPLVTVLVT